MSRSLGSGGLYPAISRKGQYDKIYAITTFIAYADGNNDLIAISDRIGCPVDMLIDIAEKLTENGLIEAEKQQGKGKG